ncbi:MAG TPA: trypsin-like peptidase domain-containing protein [Pirellula sp.]|nr:trypsin-like peptidase domain-containing protein [Pirellula sp.]
MLNLERSLIVLFCFLLETQLASYVKASSTGDCIAMEFMSDNCTQCTEMHRATEQAITNGWVVRRIDMKREPHVAMRWHITNVPTTVLVRNGREVDRILGPIPYTDLLKRLTTASSVDSVRNSSDRHRDRMENGAPIIRGQSPFGMIPIASAVALSNSATNAVNAVSSIQHDPPSLRAQSDSLRPQSNPQGATVRIRVEEPRHESVGTGTIIDSHNGEALVLTCGHLFRENHGKTVITVETFLGGQIQTYPATLIDFQANDMDIGLIAFRPIAATPVARLIPKNRTLNEGQPVFSWGCDRGALPSRRDSRITKLNRYLGAANVEADGEPVEGRSGGGLFDERGELIGVCYAADPELKEGLYNAAEVVYFELAKLGLQRLFNDRTDAQQPPSVASITNPDPVAAAPSEMTVIMRGRDGKQEQFVIPQPSPQLLQSIRESTRR